MICKLTKEDLIEISKEDTNWDVSWLTESVMDFFVSNEHSYSVYYKDKLQFCGGITLYWPGRAQIWGLFSKNSKANSLPVIRDIQRGLESLPFRRLEVCVPYHFELGKRRVKLLGFKPECEHAKAYLPDGSDVSLFSLVRDI